MHLAMHVKKLVQLCQLNWTISVSNSTDIHTHVEMRPQDTTKAEGLHHSGGAISCSLSLHSWSSQSSRCVTAVPRWDLWEAPARRSSPQPVSALKHGAAVPLHPWTRLKFAWKYEQKSCSFFAWICGRFVFVLERPARDCDGPATTAGFYSHQSWCWAFPPVWHITKTR